MYIVLFNAHTDEDRGPEKQRGCAQDHLAGIRNQTALFTKTGLVASTLQWPRVYKTPLALCLAFMSTYLWVLNAFEWRTVTHSIMLLDSGGFPTKVNSYTARQFSQLGSCPNRTKYSSSLSLKDGKSWSQPSVLPYLSSTLILTTSTLDIAKQFILPLDFEDHAHLKGNVIHMFVVPLHLNHQQYGFFAIATRCSNVLWRHFFFMRAGSWFGQE